MIIENIIEIDPEYEWQGNEELMSSTENWVHVNPEILKAGTVKHSAPPELDEDAKQDYIDKLTEKDPPTERLRSLTEDTRIDLNYISAYEEEREPWVIRKYGDQQIFNDSKDETIGHNYGVSLIRSLYWEGAMTLVIPSLKIWSFMYIGDGLKQRQEFIPKLPKEIMKEPVDLLDADEPNPMNPPSDKLESDSDAPEGEDD